MKISYLSTLFLLLGTVAAFGCEKDDTGDGTYVRQNDDDDAVRPPGTAPVTDGTGATGGTGAGGTGTGGTGAGGTGAGGTGASARGAATSPQTLRETAPPPATHKGVQPSTT